jgi:hypothetical protein
MLERLLTDQDFCVMCHLPGSIKGISVHYGGYETKDTAFISTQDNQVMLAAPSRRTFWSREHSSRGLNFSPAKGCEFFTHYNWLWDHPHWHEYDVTNRFYCSDHSNGNGDKQDVWSNLTRLEYDIIKECRALRTKWCRNNSIRLKTLNRFPGPLTKVKKHVTDKVWDMLIAHLFILYMGLTTPDVKSTLQIWNEAKRTSTFESSLLKRVLQIDEKVKVNFLNDDEGSHGFWIWRSEFICKQALLETDDEDED